MEQAYKLYYEKVNDKWEVGFMYAPDEGNKCISFVNGICTYHGGTHVNYIVKMIINKLSELILKKHKDITIKENQIKDNLIIFVKSVIVNPAFTSQTKETLKTKQTDFGSVCEIKDSTLTKFAKSGILNQVLTMIQLKEQAILKKTDGKKVVRVKGIPKLEDANKAGSKESGKCVLILTEGDSAKALAMAGRSVVGSDYVGIFPLKGKPLNVRVASNAQLLDNQEICAIKKIMAFEHGVEYTDTSSLRYGKIIIMSDQDVDGLHIKGLLLNFIHYFWPSLLKVTGTNFISSLTTPILKAFKGSNVVSFYSQSEYDEWKNTADGKWDIKYYKGLGTSTDEEAIEYFTDMYNKLINYYDDMVLTMPAGTIAHANGVKTIHEDKCTEAITLAFDKRRTHDRKTWLYNYDEAIALDNNIKIVSVSDFINKEMIHFSDEDIKRSIPSICDGMKPSQRKVLFGCFKKGITNKSKEIKVAQLAGYIGEHTEYHHGEMSLFGTIIGMAHDFIGSNNINLLHPSGQFGTRLEGGKDHSAPRYIYTYLEELTRLIFRPEDDPILTYLEEDGTKIEPKYYVPIIPMVLVNGAEGIGTGFSVKIPCFDPLVIISNLKLMMNYESIVPMNPWYKNFKGTIVQSQLKPTEYQLYGVCNKIDATHLRITELPIGKWTTSYKEFLDKLEFKKQIKSYIANNTGTIINIIIEFEEDKLEDMMNNGTVYTKLGLIKKKQITNMHLYSPEGKIKKYKTPDEILEEFYEVRYNMYVKRKEYLIGMLRKDLDILRYKMQFIKDVLSKRIIIERTKKQVIINKLIELKYPMVENDGNYDYLLKMEILNFSEEKIQELENKCKNKEQELQIVMATSENDIWLSELNELEAKYTSWLQKSTVTTQQVTSKTTKKAKAK